MNLILLLKAVVMGLVEGFTEFLPISSTGHLILVGDLMGLSDARSRVFTVVIQTGAMLAILGEYRARFVAIAKAPTRPDSLAFLANLAVAFIPAAIVGLLFGERIKDHLFRPIPVACAFIGGALIILGVERKNRAARVESVDAVTILDALKIGLIQCAALIPGTSRAGATIIGGLLIGLSRRAAAEFSFFLAVPTLLAAGAYDLWKNRAILSAADLPFFLVGSIAAFFAAHVSVRFLIRWISRRDFTIFAWYRIAFGLIVLLTHWLGWVKWTA